MPRVETGESGGAQGRLTAPFERGHALLVPKDQPLEKGRRYVFAKNAALPIPAGEYVVRRYVIEIDSEWAIWATGTGKALTVKAGEDVKLPVATDVTLKTHIMNRRGKVQLGGAFGADGMGVSVLRGRERIGVKWRVTAGARELGAGACDYG